MNSEDRKLVKELADALEMWRNFIHKDSLLVDWGEKLLKKPIQAQSALVEAARARLAQSEQCDRESVIARMIVLSDEVERHGLGDVLVEHATGRWGRPSEAEAKKTRVQLAEPKQTTCSNASLQELRGMLERIIFVGAYSSPQVSHVRLADRLMKAIEAWQQKHSGTQQ
jgi:hypothetical protein